MPPLVVDARACPPISAAICRETVLKKKLLKKPIDVQTAPDMASAGDDEQEIRDKYSEAVADTAARHSCEIDAVLATQVLRHLGPRLSQPIPSHHRCNLAALTVSFIVAFEIAIANCKLNSCSGWSGNPPIGTSSRSCEFLRRPPHSLGLLQHTTRI